MDGNFRLKLSTCYYLLIKLFPREVYVYVQNSLPMPSNARCAVDYCDNDRRYPDLWVKRSHVETLCFHKWPKDEKDDEIWCKQVLKGRKDDFNPNPGASGTFVCSNRFPKAKEPQVILTLITHPRS
jgi:hypothetical protein